jgi:hypothetical protein
VFGVPYVNETRILISVDCLSILIRSSLMTGRMLLVFLWLALLYLSETWAIHFYLPVSTKRCLKEGIQKVGRTYSYNQ